MIIQFFPDVTMDEKDRTPENRNHPSVMQCFLDFCREESLSSQWTPGTLRVWQNFGRHLQEVAGTESLDFFANEGITAFVSHLRLQAGMQDGTALKQYQNLRWFLRWAVRSGYVSEERIGRTRPKFKLVRKPVVFLRKDELLRLYHFEVPPAHTRVLLRTREGEAYGKTVRCPATLVKVRDMFCFCAFTGLRYSDMAALRWSDISGGTMCITTCKTHDRLLIPLHAFSREILDRYAGRSHPGGRIFPVMSNQKFNDYLKELCELCGFNEPLTRVCYRAGRREETTQPKFRLMGSHAGRRSFICFALSSGIPPQVVMKWTGHSDYAAMKPYIEIDEQVRSEQMQVFENHLKE